MEPNVIKFLEDKLEELKWELDLDMDEFVRQDVQRRLNDTCGMLKYFQTLIGE